MNTDKEYLKELFQLYGQNNGDAYRDNRNIKRAIKEAKRQILKEVEEAVNDLIPEVEADLYNTWFEEDIRQAKRDQFKKEVDSIKAGNITEVSKETYYHFLECLPPVKMNGSYFVAGEALRHTAEGRPVYFAFYQENGRYFGKLETL